MRDYPVELFELYVYGATTKALSGMDRGHPLISLILRASPFGEFGLKKSVREKGIPHPCLRVPGTKVTNWEINR